MSKQKILIYTNLYPSSQEPERGIFISQLAETLHQSLDIQVICPLPWCPKTKLFKKIFKSWEQIASVPNKAIINNIPVYYPRYILFPKISDSIHALLMFLKTKKLIKKICRIWQPDIILSLWIYPDAVSAILLGRQNKLPVIIGALGCDINRDIKRPLIAPQIRFALEKADHITTVSDALKDVIVQQQIDKDKVTVISTGVDKSLFHPMDQLECRSRLKIPHSHKKIITVIGQLVPVKDHKTLLKAIAGSQELANQSSLAVYFVGEGPLEHELKILASKLGLSGLINFTGQQPHSLIPVWIGASDVMCMPSIREGRPNAIMETLSCGIPVVATTVGGIPELVGEKNGLLFPPGEHLKLAKSLTSCLNKKWDKNEIVQTASHLTWETAATEYLKIISAITNKD